MPGKQVLSGAHGRRAAQQVRLPSRRCRRTVTAYSVFQIMPR
jgi:hypothetical protein